MADWPYNTAAWQRLRKVKLADRPLCQACERRGLVVDACHVDHMLAIAAGGDAFPAIDGLMSLCHRCHSEKTSAMDRAGGNGLRFKGVGPDGLPIDPDHPFFSGRPSGGIGVSKDGRPQVKDRSHRSK